MKILILNILKFLRCRLKRIGLKHGLRYQQIYDIIKKNGPKNILEIGVYDGENAIRMLKINPTIKTNYYGFDLFEDITRLQFQKEIAIQPLTLKKVEDKILEETNTNPHLYKYDTLKLKKSFFKKFPKMDLIFIDGGHSIETQRNDWSLIKNLMHKNTIVIIDDYWNLPNSGCSFMTEELDRKKYNLKVLPIIDYYAHEWGILKTQFLKITLNKPKNVELK